MRAVQTIGVGMIVVLAGAFNSSADTLGMPTSPRMISGSGELPSINRGIGAGSDGLRLPQHELVQKKEDLLKRNQVVWEAEQFHGFVREEFNERHGVELRRIPEIRDFAYPPSLNIQDYRSFRPDGMSNGDPHNPVQAPRIQSLLSNEFMPADLGIPRTTVKPGKSCALYTDDTKDECFLPVVALVRSTKGGQKVVCAGTIISRHTIVTAAHCACAGSGAVVMGTAVLPFAFALSQPAVTPEINEFSPYFIKPAAGKEVRLASVQWAHQNAFKLVKDQDTFCQRKEKEMAGDDDLAVLHMNTVSFPKKFWAKVIRPPENKAVVNIAGFGPDPLAISDRTLLKRYGSTNVVQQTRDSLFLAPQSGVRETCAGDSGSGAYLRFKDGTLGAFGVLSSGFGECTKGRKARYVNLASQRNLKFLKREVPELEIVELYELADDHADCIGVDCL